jgi:hypothetical protein
VAPNSSTPGEGKNKLPKDFAALGLPHPAGYVYPQTSHRSVIKGDKA